jgi:hypothetical protein
MRNPMELASAEHAVSGIDNASHFRTVHEVERCDDRYISL